MLREEVESVPGWEDFGWPPFIATSFEQSIGRTISISRSRVSAESEKSALDIKRTEYLVGELAVAVEGRGAFMVPFI